MSYVSTQSLRFEKNICDTFLRFDGKNFLLAGRPKYDHRNIVGLGNYMGKAFVTGCDGPECQVKTELMDMTTLEWSYGADYPFAAS